MATSLPGTSSEMSVPSRAMELDKKRQKETKTPSTSEGSTPKRQKTMNTNSTPGSSGVTASLREPSQVASILNMLVEIKENQEKLGARVEKLEVDYEYYDEPEEVHGQELVSHTPPQSGMHATKNDAQP